MLSAGEDRSQLAKSRLVAVMSAVCTGLRAALNGPGSDELWSSLTFHSSRTGLSAQQLAGYQAMLLRQGHRTHSASLRGGGWEQTELQAVLACLTGLDGRVDVSELHDPNEAATIGAALASRPIAGLSLSGSVVCALPPSVRQLHLRDVSFAHWSHHADAKQRLLQELLLQPHSQALLRSLQPLSLIEDLTLELPLWRLTQDDVNRLAALSTLSKLHLAISANSLLVHNNAECLSQLASAVCLDLSIAQLCRTPDESLELLLRQLARGRVRLHTLQLSFEDLSVAEEAALAGCWITGELVLRLRAAERRLAHPLPGVRVVYTQW